MASFLLYAEPEAVFHTKFENAGTPEQVALYDALSEAGTHVLVAAVKASGSLFLATGRRGRLVCASKNSMGSVYSDAGHYTLLRQFQSAHGPVWKDEYTRFVRFLEENHLSIGCELVTGCLGDHAEHPAKEHIVVTAVLDRRSLAPFSPLMLILLKEEFGLIIPGMFFFRSLKDFEEVYAHFRWDADATYDAITAALTARTWRALPMPYVDLHSQNVEGFVLSWVPSDHLIDAAARADSNGASSGNPPFDVSWLREALFPSGPVAARAGCGDGQSAAQAKIALPTLDALFKLDGQVTGSQHMGRRDWELGLQARIRDEMAAALGPEAVSKEMVALPLERLNAILANAEPGDTSGGPGFRDGSGQMAREFLALMFALKETRVPHKIAAFCGHGEWDGVGASSAEEIAPLGSDPNSPSEDLSARFKSQRVDGLRVRVHSTAQRPSVGEAGLEAAVVVHVLQDSAFKTYEAFRRRRSDLPLPPLVRGYTWYVRVEPHVPPRKPSRAADCDVKQTGLRRDAALRSMLEGTPCTGSMWKFKLLCYTHRTFLIRNMGLALAKSADLSAYRSQVSSWLDAWGAPMATRKDMQLLTDWWAARILSMGEAGRAELVRGGYLAPYLRALTQLRADAARARGAASVASSGEAGGSGVPFATLHSACGAAPGLGFVFLVVSCHGYALKCAQRLAEAGGVPLIPAGVLDATTLRAHLRGAVVFADVADGAAATKALHLVHALPSGSVASAVVLLDVSPEGADLALASADPPVEPDSRQGKRVMGLTRSFLKRLAEAEARGAGPASVQIDRPRDITSVAQLATWLAGEAGETLVSQGRLAAGAARESLRRNTSDLHGCSPLYVLLFVAMPGWGKNQLCERLAALDSAEGGAVVRRALGIEPGGRFEGEGNGPGLTPSIGWTSLEGDVLGKEAFWQQACAAVRNPSLGLLVLNRNFPPNSWKTLDRLRSEALAIGRPLVPIALLPRCSSHTDTAHGCTGEISGTNAFTLEELLVCLSSVQGREAHPAALDSTSSDTCRVAALFYSLYAVFSPEALFGEASALARSFDPRGRAVWVDWLQPGVRSRLSPALRDLARRVESAIHSTPEALAALEAETRQALAPGSAGSRFVAAERIAPDALIAQILAALGRAVRGVPEEKAAGPRLVQAVLPRAAISCLVNALRPHVPSSVAERLDDLMDVSGVCVLDSSARLRSLGEAMEVDKEYHLTLWHCNGQGHPRQLPQSLKAAEGCKVHMRLVRFVADSVAAAVEVELLYQTSGGANVDQPQCFNAHPHITLWSLPGHAKHSNVLLSDVCRTSQVGNSSQRETPSPGIGQRDLDCTGRGGSSRLSHSTIASSNTQEGAEEPIANVFSLDLAALALSSDDEQSVGVLCGRVEHVQWI